MSPSGLDAFNKHAGAVAARRSGGGDWQRIDYFGLKDGEVARIRFLEQGEQLSWAISHRIMTPGQKYPQDILCLDQEDEGVKCPACFSENKEVRSRSTKGYLNVIWRGTEDSEYTRAPLYKKNDKGWVEKINNQKVVTGFEDSVFMWKCNKRTFEQILAKDKTYKGLMSRDFIILRKGSEKENTMYFVEPAVVDGGPEAMTVADQNIAQSKFDLVKLTTPGSYDEMVQLLSGQNSAGSNQGTFNREPNQPNPEDVFSGQPMRSSAFQR